MLITRHLYHMLSVLVVNNVNIDFFSLKQIPIFTKGCIIFFLELPHLDTLAHATHSTIHY